MLHFKFLQNHKPQALFQFEITNDISRSGDITWCREYSDAVRRWVSDLYFLDLYGNSFYHLTYIQSIDKTCELMTTPSVVSRQHHSPYFSVKVKIWETPDVWLIAELSYPIEHVIYR